MRQLIVVRGAAGAGKTRFVEQNDLEPFHLSMSNIRASHSGFFTSTDGRLHWDFSRERQLWDHVAGLVEARMLEGELIVFEGNLQRTDEIAMLASLARRHLYEVSIIDMSDVPLAECLARNADRKSWFQAPDEAIIKTYQRYE